MISSIPFEVQILWYLYDYDIPHLLFNSLSRLLQVPVQTPLPELLIDAIYIDQYRLLQHGISTVVPVDRRVIWLGKTHLKGAEEVGNAKIQFHISNTVKVSTLREQCMF